MKISKVLHVASVIAGAVGVVTFLGAVFNSTNGMVFGVTKMDSLVCSAILILIATWLQIATMHHMELEKKGERI